jgi:hypothetical protein
MIASKEYRLNRAVVMKGTVKLDKDADFEVVTAKCTNDSELKAITKMAYLARDEPKNCFAKEIVRCMRKCRAHGEDGCGRTG